MQEIWKDIKKYEGLYQVSNLGKVKSLERFTKNNKINTIGYIKKQKILKLDLLNNGYNTCELYKNNRRKKFYIHRLVAETFIPNPENKPQVNHINGIKTDNRVENLEWVSAKENIKHGWKNELYKNVLKSLIENSRRSKKVNQYDKQGKLINTFSSTVEAEKKLKEKGVKINSKNIRAVCANRRKTAGGFVWKYAN